MLVLTVLPSVTPNRMVLLLLSLVETILSVSAPHNFNFFLCCLFVNVWKSNPVVTHHTFFIVSHIPNNAASKQFVWWVRLCTIFSQCDVYLKTSAEFLPISIDMNTFVSLRHESCLLHFPVPVSFTISFVSALSHHSGPQEAVMTDHVGAQRLTDTSV